MIKSQEFNFNGHTYKVTRIENTDRYSVVRDGRKVRTISNLALNVAISNKELGHVLERLFNDEKR